MSQAGRAPSPKSAVSLGSPKAWTANKLKFYETIIGDKSLAPAAKVVAWALLSHFNRTTGTAWPAINTLAAETSCDRKTVFRAMRQLSEGGWFETLRKGRGEGFGSSIYGLGRRWVEICPLGENNPESEPEQQINGAEIPANGAERDLGAGQKRDTNPDPEPIENPSAPSLARSRGAKAVADSRRQRLLRVHTLVTNNPAPPPPPPAHRNLNISPEEEAEQVAELSRQAEILTARAGGGR